MHNQGWWSDSALSGSDDNTNIVVGSDFGDDFRNFFTFDLTQLPEGTGVISATLRIRRYYSSPNNESIETLEFFDVSTNATTLNENSGLNPAIFADLGSGTSYGAFDVPGDGDILEVLEFALDGDALADIQSAAGGFFSIGGVLTSAVSTPDTRGDYLFGVSGGQLNGEQLVIVIPEPVTGALLLLGLFGLARLRSPRGQRSGGPTSGLPTYT